MGTSSKKSKRNFVPMVHPGTVEVVPMVKNRVNKGRSRWILYAYLNYLAKYGKYRNAVKSGVKIISPCIRPKNSAEIEEIYA